MTHTTGKVEISMSDDPPKGPSRMVVSAVPVCPYCKTEKIDSGALDWLKTLGHGDFTCMFCRDCDHGFRLQALVSRDGITRTYRTIPNIEEQIEEQINELVNSFDEAVKGYIKRIEDLLEEKAETLAVLKWYEDRVANYNKNTLEGSYARSALAADHGRKTEAAIRKARDLDKCQEICEEWLAEKREIKKARGEE